MNKIATLTITAVAAICYSIGAYAEVESLRGDELTTMAKKSERMQLMEVKGGIERSYKQQPPMVPHKVDDYQVNLKVNACLSCHSEKTYEEKHAPKIGDSHYENRDGKVLETLSSRRYFCSQCHAPQLNAKPLVQNNFQGQK